MIIWQIDWLTDWLIDWLVHTEMVHTEVPQGWDTPTTLKSTSRIS